MVFIEIKHKIGSDVTYFKLHLTIIKFPTPEILSEWGGGFTSVSYIFGGIFMVQGVAALKIKGNLYFLINLHTQSNKHILVMNSLCYPKKLDERLSCTTFCVPYDICVQYDI